MTDAPQRDPAERNDASDPGGSHESDAVDSAREGTAGASRETVGDRLAELLSEHREDEDGPEQQGTPDAQPDPFDPFAPDPAEEAAEDQHDGQHGSRDDLPDAPLFALLRTLEEQISPVNTDRLWIFPPRRIEAGETAVVVVAAFPPADPARRRVYAAHYTALDDSDQHRLAVAEYGTAPTDRVGRLVEEVVERINEGPAAAPRSFRIQGDPLRWHQALHELAEELLEERRRNRRII